MVTSYEFFALQKQQGFFGGIRTRELVAQCLGCSPKTVERVVARINASTGIDVQQVAESNRGRPRGYDLEAIAPTVREFVVTQNRNAQPTTARRIAAEVESECDVLLSEDAMTRALHEMGFHHIKGETRNIMADSEGNMAFRKVYLERKLANRVATAGPNGSVRRGVDRPEVYLDESFCNVNHVSDKTWLTSEKICYGKSGKGARACIIAAGIIHSRGAVTTGHFVENSIRVWNSTLKRGRDGEEDYHGNFDAELFEVWFEQLCQTLQRFGGCNIYIDGASYHKRNGNKSPRKKWLKADIQEWLRKSAGMVFSPKATIDVLLGLVEFYRLEVEYVAVKIAGKYGHIVCYTPPYHPSLQPIELIWGTVKNRIAKFPAKNGGDLVAKVLEGLDACNGDWVKVYRHVQKKEDAFAL